MPLKLKPFLRNPQQKRAVNEEAFFHYLSFLTSPAPLTLFEGINKLPAATWLKISAKTGDIEEKKYWMSGIILPFKPY